MVQNLDENFQKKIHEARQIDQRKVLNAKMYYVVGAKNHFFFFQRSKVVKIGHNWPAEFRSRHFVIGGWVPPPPPAHQHFFLPWDPGWACTNGLGIPCVRSTKVYYSSVPSQPSGLRPQQCLWVSVTNPCLLLQGLHFGCCEIPYISSMIDFSSHKSTALRASSKRTPLHYMTKVADEDGEDCAALQMVALPTPSPRIPSQARVFERIKTPSTLLPRCSNVLQPTACTSAP